MNADLKSIADRIDSGTRDRERFQPIRLEGKPLDLEQAYDVQADIVARARARGAHAPIGFKVGLTSKTMQEFCGVTQPVVGRILGDRVRPNGGRLIAGDYIRLGLESELAVRISKPLPVLNEGADVARLIDHIDAIAAAFEIIDDRDADYEALDAFSIIAENSWNMGMVLGDLAAPNSVSDLANLGGRLLVDGQQVAAGTSSDVMGGPLHVLAWLARFTAETGLPLDPGDWVMTGSIMPSRFAKAGQTFRFELGPLGAVEVSID